MKKQLKKRQELRNEKRLAIIIIIKNKVKALKFYATKLQFEEIPKVIAKYCKTKPSSIYITCSNITYDWLEGYKKKPIQFVIYFRVHKSENHKYKINGCITKRKKIYKHILPKYENNGGNYLTTVFKYSTRQKP